MEKNNQTKGAIVKACVIFFALLLVMCGAAFFKLRFFQNQKGFGRQGMLGFALLAAGLSATVFVYAIYGILARKHLVARPAELALVCFVIALTYVVCIFAENVSVYLMPVFLASFLLAPLIKRKDSFAANLFCVFAILITLTVNNNVGGNASDAVLGDLKLFISASVGIFAGTLVVFGLSYLRRRLDFLLRGVAVCAGALVVILLLDFMLPIMFSSSVSDAAREITKTLRWASIAVFSQLVLSLILQPVLEKAFNVLTNLRLIELTDHHSPLIKRLISEAPGTFNHSLNVANFAEVCATAIGENPYFARAAAYYHDIGKLVNPMFFKENQPDSNPHDDILPEVSAEIVRGHTTEGLQLCREYKVPQQIAAITAQHHGTMPISVFYDKAKRLTDVGVDVKEYSYAGETPKTKVAAIIMICDSAEAAIRATETNDSEKANAIVTSILFDRIRSGQFNDCPITLADLHIVKESIVNACGGVYHKRLKYPDKVGEK